MSRYTTPRPGGGLVNTHTRLTLGPMARAGELLERIAEPGIGPWPSDRWPPLRLDHGLDVGSRGGHGAIRYHVEAHTLGRSVTFRFEPTMPLRGTHTFSIDPEDALVRWTHVLDVETLTPFIRFVVLPLHDAVLEDLLDAAQAHLAGVATVRRRLPWRVTLLRKIAARSGRSPRPAA